jgi:hypothetical protein
VHRWMHQQVMDGRGSRCCRRRPCACRTKRMQEIVVAGCVQRLEKWHDRESDSTAADQHAGRRLVCSRIRPARGTFLPENKWRCVSPPIWARLARKLRVELGRAGGLGSRANCVRQLYRHFESSVSLFEKQAALASRQGPGRPRPRRAVLPE